MNALDRGIAVAVVFFVVLGVVDVATAQSEQGVAHFYNDSFQGKKTSSGEPYDKNGLTAAHKKLAYGTKVKVTNVANGKSVVVTVNDRLGTSSPAVIDVTRRAAEQLDFVKSGKTTVKLEVVK
jgi:rare lipoprotein A